MFVYPFRRLVRYTVNSVTVTRDCNYSATAPVFAITEFTPSTQARAQQENSTYYSFPTEFS